MSRIAFLRTAACAAALAVLSCGTPRSPRHAVAPSATASPASDLAARVDAIFAEHAHPDGPGCAVGVYRAGEVVFARGYGAADLEHGVPIDANSVFDIGSISKQFTAATVALLAQDGKLSLDDDVRKYVPELPDFGHVVRIRHLLFHTGGLREVYDLLPLSGFMSLDLCDETDGLFALTHQKAPYFAPGTAWRYSSTGYFLLSIVVRRVTGKSLGDVAHERIFEPLGMKSTRILDKSIRVVAHRASPYEASEDGAGFVSPMTNNRLTGATGLYTTVADLARWDANFYAPKVGGKPLLEALRTPGRLDDGRPLDYAMGLVETTQAGLAREEHTGSDMGFSADLVRYPDERLAVAVLCNDDGIDAGQLAQRVAAVLLPRLARGEAAASPPPVADDAAAKLPTLGVTSPQPAARSAIAERTIDAACGAYYDAKYQGVLALRRDGGDLVMSLGLGAGAPAIPLNAIDARTFGERGGDPATRYVFDEAKRTLTRLHPYADTVTFDRFEPVAVAPAALAAYAGRYTSDEVRDDRQIAVQDGALVFRPWARARGVTTLSPIGRDVFAGEGGLPFAVAIAFERDAKGAIRGFTMKGGDMEIAFRKRGAGANGD